MDKKTQQKIHDNMRTCDDDHAKHMKQESISELNLLKLIDLSRSLSDLSPIAWYNTGLAKNES